MELRLCNVYFLIILVQNVASELGSLTFVIDETYSMGHVIATVKQGAAAIFDTVEEHRNQSQIDNFVVVTFNDRSLSHRDADVKVRANTNNRNVFISSLQQIYLEDGGDCPEMALAGILKGLEESRPRSLLFVFTDATAKDYDKFQQVKKLAQMKLSQIVFILTGMCMESASSRGYTVYEDLAEATNGQVFHLREVDKILEYVKKTITGQRTTLIRKTLSPGFNSFNFNVDPMMSELLGSLSASETIDPKAIITDSQSEFIPTSLLETDRALVFSADLTNPGSYFVEVESNAGARLVISAKSKVDFRHGFSSFKPSSIVDTSAQPAPGKTYLSIKLIEGDVELKSVQILDMNDNVLYDLPLEAQNGETKLYSTEAFDPPEHMFDLVVTGYDPETKSKIIRRSATPIEVQQNN